MTSRSNAVGAAGNGIDVGSQSLSGNVGFGSSGSRQTNNGSARGPQLTLSKKAALPIESEFPSIGRTRQSNDRASDFFH